MGWAAHFPEKMEVVDCCMPKQKKRLVSAKLTHVIFVKVLYLGFFWEF